MRKKASIQVSVNFLVVIIISIIIMGFGFVLIKKMVGSGGNTIGNLDEHLRKQIENTMLSEGKPVMIPIVQQTSSRGKIVSFGVGVLNLLEDEGPTNFEISGEYNKAVNLKTREEIGNVPKDNLPTVMEGFYDEDIKNNDDYVFSLNINIPKKVLSGYEYVFDVTVTCDDSSNSDCNPYSGSTYKLYVKVP